MVTVKARAGADLDVDVEAVAAGHAAGGVDDDGLERVAAVGVREAHPQRARLVHARRAGSPPAAAATAKRDASNRAIAGEHVVACRRVPSIASRQ